MDVKKAFDSVSHQSILVAALRVGVPLPFLGYIRELYSDAVTTLRIGQERSDPIKLGLWLTGVWGCSGSTPNTARSYIAFTMVRGNLTGTALR